MEINIKVGGEAGFGIMASGLVLVRTFSRGGLSAITINDYPSLIRGGHNVIHVAISDTQIFATDTYTDILIALNKDSIDLHKDELNQGCAIIFDPDSTPTPNHGFSKTVKLIPVPLFKLTQELGGDILMRNTVAVGAVIGLLDYDFNFLAKVLSDQFQKKGEAVISKNIALAKSGFDYVKSNFSQGFHKKISPKLNPPKQLVVSGNEAIGLGAIAAGMKFFAAYPMTPINGLLSYVSSVSEKSGIVYKQPEDEISGINMAIGASFAGVRSMVATSGGGFALMVEGASLAGMLEQPVVIIYGQRPGPSTGLPTWTTQGDLHFVLNAGQGEFPRLVLAPGDAEEAYYLTAEAFNLADKYQTTVFVLVDKYLCESYFSVDMANLSAKVEIDRGKMLSEEEQTKDQEAKRYLLTDDGISPRPIPGRKGGVFRVNSDEHDEWGYSAEGSANTKRMIEKRMQKMYEVQSLVPDPKLFGHPDAKHTLVGWGSTKGAGLEVIRRLEAEGKKDFINYLHISWINPFPSAKITEYLRKAHHSICIEGNHNGQMADWIFLKTGIKIADSIRKYDGRPFYPDEVIKQIINYG